MRMNIKKNVSSIIFHSIKGGRQNDLASELNKYITENAKSTPYAIHYVRASLGMSPIPESPLTQDEVEVALFSKKSVRDPIVEVVPQICEKCTDDHVTVTDLCMSCSAHPCDHVCPVNAIKVFTDRSQKTAIDPNICIRCEECMKVCPYSAIVHRYRPCKAACGTEAITIGKDNRSYIEQSKCASCGLCTVACPFGAIIHKSEIGNVIAKLAQHNDSRKIAAIVAPAFINQFGTKHQPADVFAAIKKCGFDHVIEVAFGADMDTVEIAEKLHQKKEGDYIGTSCCPSWLRTVRKHYPSQLKHIVPSFAPMVETARALKQSDPEIDVVFVGPCVAKISETLEPKMSKYVEHAITFEEMACIFDFLNVKIEKTNNKLNQASSYGRGYAVAGGVAEAVIKAAEKTYGMKNIKAERADTLLKCRQMLKKLESGELKPDIVEGMGCLGGCIGGAGCIATPKKIKSKVLAFKKNATLSLEESIKQTYEDLCSK
ncbi:hydrogenase large subunit domain-containing protein [Tritrichomonas foetus]|uniref:Hydrogenase large subunit domain-containing protein n=1 Tax=Tritrichomonas foetus TaxID=1144522 RepID=A0A1J4JVF8_9EUKA|nr:hydrogenase large subunit domain-containing protein [Tritrichomonas foetus]|eukprot:OHT02995.1 hydrogenase large subunit domain-containing protein [Tritrichomonas foetus]